MVKEEEEVCRITMDKYHQFQDNFIKHSPSNLQVAIDLSTLYDHLVEGLNLEVIASPAGCFSSHILLILDAAKKLPAVNHAYHFQRVSHDNNQVDVIATVISEKRLKTEFAAVLADIIWNLE
jgi:hypothetical protein